MTWLQASSAQSLHLMEVLLRWSIDTEWGTYCRRENIIITIIIIVYHHHHSITTSMLLQVGLAEANLDESQQQVWWYGDGDNEDTLSDHYHCYPINVINIIINNNNNRVTVDKLSELDRSLTRVLSKVQYSTFSPLVRTVVVLSYVLQRHCHCASIYLSICIFIHSSISLLAYVEEEERSIERLPTRLYSDPHHSNRWPERRLLRSGEYPRPVSSEC